jgi:hypothetical protein
VSPSVTKTPAPKEAARLGDADLAKVLKLIGDADSVELKATVAVDNHRATIQCLPMDPVEAQPRMVYFYDTPDLALFRAGVVVRTRRVQGGRGDTVIKLRPVVPNDLPASLRRQADFNVEVDVLPGGYVCSASFKGRSSGQDVWDAARGGLRLRKLFSKTQRAFFADHAPAGITLDDIVPLGPTMLLKSRFDVRLAPGKRVTPQSLVAELWFYPDGSRILELSTKCPPVDALSVGLATRAYLVGQGVVLAPEQQTKTRTALEYYAQAPDLATPKTTNGTNGANGTNGSSGAKA